MAQISNTAVRRAIVSHLQGDTNVTDLQPADRIYGPQPPALPQWPFTQYGVPIDTPLRASCLDGQVINFAIHTFAKGPGENQAEEIGSAIAYSLDGRSLELTEPYAGRAKVRYTGGSTIRDDADANSWHRITNLEVRVFT